MLDDSQNHVEILLVEDNPNDVELTIDALQENKISNRVQVVRDGAEALDFIFRRGTFAKRPNSKPKVIYST